MKATIESFFESQKSSSTFFRALDEGRFNSTHLKLYMSNVYHLIKRTPDLLKRGIAIAHARNLPHLAAYYQLKYGEEADHHEWAREDVALINKVHGFQDIEPPLPAVVRLGNMVFEDLELNPYSYVSYIFIGEYFTVLAGPWILERIEHKCGLDPQQLSVVASHVELDKDHVTESIEEMEQLFAHGMDRATHLSDLKRYCAVISEFYQEIMSHSLSEIPSQGHNQPSTAKEFHSS